MPSFLNWPTALIAAGIAVPLLLLLYFLKLRRQEMAVSSTLLWKKAVQDLQVNAPFQRLRRNLLLLLQMLLLLLIVLAMARPVMNYTRRAGKATVILIDRSASMSAADVDGKTRLVEAKRRARELVDTLDKGASAMVIAFADTAQTVQSFTGDRLKLKAAIDGIEPSDRPSALSDAFALAEAQATVFIPEQLRATTERPVVYVFSDGRVSDRDKVALRVGDLRYEPIGSETPANIAVVALSAKRNYQHPTEVQIFARLANYGPVPVEDVDVLLAVDGQVQRIDQRLLLMPESWSSEQTGKWLKENNKAKRDGVDFTLDLFTSAIVKVEHMNKEGDLLPADDMAQIVVPPPRPLAALAVCDDNYFLTLAINALGLKDPAIITPDEYERRIKDPQDIAAKYDVILFDCAGGKYEPSALPPAGNFVYFGCLPPKVPPQPGQPASPAPKWATDQGAPIIDSDVGVIDWEREHAILRGLDLSRLYIGKMRRMDVPRGAQTLIEGTHGPLAVLWREGRSVHVALGFDLLESNFPVRPKLFPVFMNQLMQYLAVGQEMDLRQSERPGATPVIPRINLQQAGDLSEFRLSGPGGSKTITVPQAGDVALPALEKVGLYSTDPPIPQYEKIAVNLLDPIESNLAPVKESPGGSGGDAAAVAGNKPLLDLWWWILACAIIPLCLAEWWVYTRRMHL